jgi:zinc/manganese transport system permease protein
MPSRRIRIITTTTKTWKSSRFGSMQAVLHALVEPGFFSSPNVQVALAIGGLVAIVASGVGVFTVLRGQSFAGEALGDIGAAGGSSAYLIGIGPLWGFLGINVAAAAAMEIIGIQRARGRDLATGIVLGLGFGLAALFLYLGALHSSNSGAPVQILFGSLFLLPSSDLPLVLGFAALTAVALVILYRPLLLISISPELGAARGIPVRLISAAYLLAMAIAIALSALTIGAILSTALLVGPAATALRLTTRPGRTFVAAAAIGLACTWLGLLLAWDSYYWPPLRSGWPVSFFVVTLVLIAYIAAGLRTGQSGGGRR